MDSGVARAASFPGHRHRAPDRGIGKHGASRSPGAGQPTEDLAWASSQVAAPATASEAVRGAVSILEQRLRIRDLLQDSSSLRPVFAEAVASAYGDGARLASKEAGSPRSDFPDQSPFSLDALLDDDWLPEECEQLFWAPPPRATLGSGITCENPREGRGAERPSHRFLCPRCLWHLCGSWLDAAIRS